MHPFTFLFCFLHRCLCLSGFLVGGRSFLIFFGLLLLNVKCLAEVIEWVRWPCQPKICLFSFEVWGLSLILAQPYSITWYLFSEWISSIRILRYWRRSINTLRNLHSMAVVGVFSIREKIRSRSLVRYALGHSLFIFLLHLPLLLNPLQKKVWLLNWVQCGGSLTVAWNYKFKVW